MHSSVLSLIENSINYDLFWCEHKQAEKYVCDWRIDPCLVVIYTPDVPYRLWIEKEGKVSQFTAENGQALIIPAGTKHKLHADPCFVTGINIHYTFLGIMDVLSMYDMPHLITNHYAQILQQYIQALVATVGRRSVTKSANHALSDGLGTVIKENRICYSILETIIEIGTLKPNSTAFFASNHWLLPVLNFVEENLAERLEIKDLASIAALSEHRFSTLFKAYMSQSPGQYIMFRRLNSAMRLLLVTAESVSSIARQTGFYDQPHFTRNFTKATGMSPMQYRKSKLFDSGAEKC